MTNGLCVFNIAEPTSSLFSLRVTDMILMMQPLTSVLEPHMSMQSLFCFSTHLIIYQTVILCLPAHHSAQSH